MDRRWTQVVAAAFFINTSYGTLSYSFSVLVTDKAAGGEFGTTTVSIGFGLALLISGAAALVAGTIADLSGSRRLMAAGSVAGALGLVLLSQCQSGWQMLLVMAIFIGPAMAATFYEPVYVLMNRWFDASSRPRAYGVLTLVSGFSITIFTPLTNALVEGAGWRVAVACLGGILLVIGVGIPLLVLHEPRAPVSGHRTSAAAMLRQTFEGIREGNARFWTFTLAFFAANAAFSGFSFHMVAQLESRGFAPADVANVVAVAGILSLPARLILPALSGRAPTSALLPACVALLGLAAIIASIAGAWWQVWIYIIVFGAVFGALYPLRALATSERFSGEYYGRLLGTQALFVAVSRALGPAAIGAFVGAGGSYVFSFRVAAAILFASTIVIAAVLRLPPAGEAVLDAPSLTVR
ncbi:hypothetical protein AYO38_04450 [bacterium SCGC AG-212-C10]|nr:hypothetical protein AYO38_04450 [bacterium SCGC AG-212-C10]